MSAAPEKFRFHAGSLYSGDKKIALFYKTKILTEKCDGEDWTAMWDRTKPAREALEKADNEVCRSIVGALNNHDALVAERDMLRNALKKCAAVLSGEAFSKSELINALEITKTALEKTSDE